MKNTAGSVNDALQRPLVLGAAYGYSSGANGVTDVVVGRLVKINASTVTIEVVSMHSLVGDSVHSVNGKTGTKRSVRSGILFPVGV